MIEVPNSKFSSVDFGTKPTTSELERIDVTINANFMLGDFAQQYSLELNRRNPIKFKANPIDADELTRYFTGLIAIRVESVLGISKVWREAKQLVIPSWIQFVISQVGRVIDAVRGLEFMPKLNYEYDINDLLATSDKLRVWMVDGVTMHQDAFPRSKDGDKETMSMAIVDNYVKSISETSHPITSYVSAFLGAQLEKEEAFKILYRVRYDDVAFIKTMLLHDEAFL